MNPSDFLSTVAQVAVAIAGFSGIVVAVGQRTVRDLAPVDRVRLVGLVADTSLALMLSLMTMILLNTDIALSRVWLVCSAVEAIVIPVSYGIRFRYAFRTAAADVTRAHARATLAIFLPILIVVFLLQAYNVVLLREFWPFAVGLVFHVWASLAVFGGLLFMVRGRDA